MNQKVWEVFDAAERADAMLTPAEDARVKSKLRALAAIWSVHMELFPNGDPHEVFAGTSASGGASGGGGGVGGSGDGVRASDPGSYGVGGGCGGVLAGSTAERSSVARASFEPGGGGGNPRASSEDPHRASRHSRHSFLSSHSDTASAVHAAGAAAVAAAAAAAAVGPRSSLIGVVEVAWLGAVHRTAFPLPMEARHLTEHTKTNFLRKARLLTTEKRVQSLVGP